jgi:hypothetical protein
VWSGFYKSVNLFLYFQRFADSILVVRILAYFGKFYKSRFQRHSSTPPQFWLILPNSNCFSFYTTSNSGWFYEIWLILPKSISRLNSMTRYGLSKFSGISPLNSAEFRWIHMISEKNRQYRMALMLDQDLNVNFFILRNFNTTLLVEKVLLNSGALSWIQRPFRAKSFEWERAVVG